MSNEPFRLGDACFVVDGIVYINADHPAAATFQADRPDMPAINQIAFKRLLELAEANRRLRATCRESADAYQRGYTQGMADAAAQAAEQTGSGANLTDGNAVNNWHSAAKQDSNP